MAYPNTNKPYKLYTDACDYAIGAILVQDDDEGVERVIHYVSHQLSELQKKWATIEKEAYAVIYALQKLRNFYGGPTLQYLRTINLSNTCFYKRSKTHASNDGLYSEQNLGRRSNIGQAKACPCRYVEPDKT